MRKAFGFLAVLLLLTAPQVYSAASSDQYLNAGNTLYQQKNYNKAILYYKAAIQVDPNNAAAHTRLANTYYMLGQKSDALTQYQAALALDPNNTQLSAFVQKLQAQVGGSSPAQTGYVPAGAATVTPVSERGMFLGLGAGIDLPQTQGVTITSTGVELQLGYNFDNNFAVRLQIDAFFASPVTNLMVLDLRLLPEIKYTFGGKGFQPYLFGGVGFDVYSATYSSGDSSSISGMDYVIGAGGQFDLSPKLKFYAELKYHSASLTANSNGSAASGTANNISVSDLPFTVGLLLGL